MKSTTRLLLVCLMSVVLLAVSHNAFARKAKAVADQVNATTTAVADQASTTTAAVANQANTATTAVANQANTATAAVANQVSAQKTNQVVSLNSATVDQLTQIKGIGPKTAQAIIDKRTELGGKFTSIDQLMQVKGIKQKRLDKIKPFLSL